MVYSIHYTRDTALCWTNAIAAAAIPTRENTDCEYILLDENKWSDVWHGSLVSLVHVFGLYFSSMM